MKKLILPILLNLFAFGIGFGQTSPAPLIVKQPEEESKKAPPLDLNNLVGLKGETAPAFTLPAMNGTEYNLESLRGKIVVINLWGTFCAPCLKEIPKLNAIVQKYKGKDVVFLAPAPDEKADLESFLRKHPFDYQVLPNAFSVIKDYAPHKPSDDPKKKGGFMMLLPTHLVIDQNGLVTYHKWGFGEDTITTISGEIDRLLSEKKSK